jgi:hypothetical protein
MAITRLLGGFRNGEPDAEARLMEVAYRELLKIAALRSGQVVVNLIS